MKFAYLLWVVSLFVVVQVCLSQSCSQSFSYTTPSQNESGILSFYQGITTSSNDLLYLFTFEDYTPSDGATNLVTNLREGQACPATTCNGNPVVPEYLAGGICGAAPQFDFNVPNAIYVDRDLNPTTVPLMTWGAWVNPAYLVSQGPTGASHYNAILSTDNSGFDRHITIDERNNCGGRLTNHFAIFAGNDGVQGAEPSTATDQCRQVISDTWHFVAATYNNAAGTVNFYVGYAGDPTFQLRSLTGVTFGTSQTFFLVGSNPSYAEHWNGLIDEVFVYQAELTEAQLQEIYDFYRLDHCTTTETVAGGSGSDFMIFQDDSLGLALSSADGTLYACPDANGNLRDVCAALSPS